VFISPPALVLVQTPYWGYRLSFGFLNREDETDTSGRNYHHPLRNNPEERSFHQGIHCGSVNLEKVVVQYTIGAREKMREKARRHARRNAYRREGLIKEQLTALNEIRSGLLNDLVL
jgi:hypothetical protein